MVKDIVLLYGLSPILHRKHAGWCQMGQISMKTIALPCLLKCVMVATENRK